MDTFVFSTFVRRYYLYTFIVSDMHLELAQRFPEQQTLRPWQAALVERLQQPITPADRTVNWYHEATGATGKSWLARHLALRHNAVHVQMMNATTCCTCWDAGSR